MTAVARHTDPETSKAAAASVRDLSDAHQRIYTLFQKYGPMTDTTLRRMYQIEWLRPISDSGLRTRRNELVEAGLIEDTGARGRLDSGRASIVWGLAEEVQRNG